MLIISKLFPISDPDARSGELVVSIEVLAAGESLSCQFPFPFDLKYTTAMGKI